MKSISNEALQSILGSKTVAFHSIFAKAMGSVPAAVFLSQALFWQEGAKYSPDTIEIKGAKYFKKKSEEWYDETGLTKEQQAGCRKILREFDILKEELAGVPAKMHFSIDIDATVAVIYRYLETGKPVRVDNRSKLREITRDSSGKFRQLEAAKNGNSYIESLESLESGGENAPAPAKPEISSDLNTELKKALTPNSAGPLPQLPPNWSARPKAHTADELRAELANFYRPYPEQWRATIDGTPAANWPADKTKDVVENFCAWAIGEGYNGRTFQQINARLKRWFKDEPIMSRQQATAPANTSTTLPKTMKVYGS